jgi:hypothetical protein
VAGPEEPGLADEETAALVHALRPHIAYVLSPRFDVLVHNRAAEIIMADLVSRPPHRRNLLLWLFDGQTDWGGRGQEWEATARANLMDFRTEYARHPDDPSLPAACRRADREQRGAAGLVGRARGAGTRAGQEADQARDAGAAEPAPVAVLPGAPAVAAAADAGPGRRPHPPHPGQRRNLHVEVTEPGALLTEPGSRPAPDPVPDPAGVVRFGGPPLGHPADSGNPEVVIS